MGMLSAVGGSIFRAIVTVTARTATVTSTRGAGIVCTLYHSDPQDPDDGSTPFEWTEKTVRACLDGWTSEKTAKTRLFADIGFSISRRTESDGGISVARVQACRHTSEPRTVDEHARPYVHIEIFTESPDAGRR